jgi:hypothetical protein
MATPRLTARSRRLPSSLGSELWEALAEGAARESSLWSQALRPRAERETEPIFSRLAEPRFALGVETIYEGYLVHYARPRLFAPADRDTALLLGDYLYAHGIVRVAELGHVAAIGDLAELISLCAQLQAQLVGRANGRPCDGAAWAATAALLGTDALASARMALRDRGDPEPLAALARTAAGAAAVDGAVAAHRLRLG